MSSFRSNQTSPPPLLLPSFLWERERGVSNSIFYFFGWKLGRAEKLKWSQVSHGGIQSQYRDFIGSCWLPVMAESEWVEVESSHSPNIRYLGKTSVLPGNIEFNMNVDITLSTVQCPGYYVHTYILNQINLILSRPAPLFPQKSWKFCESVS